MPTSTCSAVAKAVCAREVRQAQQGEDAPISVPNAPIAAIKYRIQAKCVKRYAAKPGYELSLLLAANIPQFGGVAATTLFPPLSRKRR